MSDQIKYCYSDDEERFRYADATTRDGAAEEARHELLSDREPGEQAMVWVGVRHDAEALLESRHKAIGEHICDTLDEWLSDDIAWDDPVCTLPKDAQAELGRLVVNFIKERGGFKAYAVLEITSHEVTVPEDEPATPVA